MSWTARERLTLGLLLAVAFGLLAGAWVLPSRGPVIDHYDRLAGNLLAGSGLAFDPTVGPTVARGPVYPAWLALGLLFGRGTLYAARMLDVLLLLGTAALTYTCARRVSEQSSALLAAGIVGLNPLLAWYTLKLGSETLSAFLFAAVGRLTLALVESPRTRTAVALGAVAGIAALTKSAFLVLLPVVGLVLLAGVGMRQALRSWFVVAGVAALIVFSWMWRNERVSGVWVPVQTLAGWNFWYDFDLDRAWAEGRLSVSGADAVVFERFGADYLGHPYRLNASEDAAQDRWLRAEAWAWVGAHPGGLIRKSAANSVQFWMQVSSFSASVVLAAVRSVELIFLAVGVWAAARRRAYALIAWSLGVSLALMLLTSPILGVFRHSLVLVSPLGLLEAEGLLFLGTTVAAGWTALRGTRQHLPRAAS